MEPKPNQSQSSLPLASDCLRDGHVTAPNTPRLSFKVMVVVTMQGTSLLPKMLREFKRWEQFAALCPSGGKGLLK